MIKDHILQNICSGHDYTFHALMRWLNHAVAGDKPCGNAIVLRGPHGCGTSFFGHTILSHVFGSGTVALSSISFLTGFNSILKDCRYLFLDDLPKFPRYGLVLKTILEEPKIIIKEKGKNPVALDNHIHVMMSVAPNWKPPKNIPERRFFVIDVPLREGIDYGRLVKEGAGDLMS